MTTRRDFIKGLIAAGILPAIGQAESTGLDLRFSVNGIEVKPINLEVKALIDFNMPNHAPSDATDACVYTMPTYGRTHTIIAEFSCDPFPYKSREPWDIDLHIGAPHSCGVAWKQCALTAFAEGLDMVRYEWTHSPRMATPYRLTATERKAERAQAVNE